MIRVEQSKGAKDRYTLLAQRALEVLRDYWRAYRPKEWLFPGQAAKGPLSVASVQRIFGKVLQEAGIKKHATVHTLRHPAKAGRPTFWRRGPIFTIFSVCWGMRLPRPQRSIFT